MIKNLNNLNTKKLLLKWFITQLIRWVEPPRVDKTADLGNFGEETKSAEDANETKVSKRVDSTMSEGE